MQVLIRIFFVFQKFSNYFNVLGEKKPLKRCKNMYVWIHIFSFAQCFNMA